MKTYTALNEQNICIELVPKSDLALANSKIAELEDKLKAKHAWLNPPLCVGKDGLLEYYHDHADAFKYEWDKAEATISRQALAIAALKEQRNWSMGNPTHNSLERIKSARISMDLEIEQILTSPNGQEK